MLPVKIQLEDHTCGSQWEGILSIGPILINGAAPSHAVDTCSLQFRSRPTGALGQELNEADGITINDPVTWDFTIPPLVLDLTAGKYDWEFKAFDTEGVPRAYYKGVFTMRAAVNHV